MYVRWAGLVWRGEVAVVIEELRGRQQEVGEPTAQDKETSVRRVVKEGLTYLENQQGRMKYAEYRRRGLPITSSHVESEIKRINQRVKGTEKFWGTAGAEAHPPVAPTISATTTRWTTSGKTGKRRKPGNDAIAEPPDTQPR